MNFLISFATLFLKLYIQPQAPAEWAGSGRTAPMHSLLQAGDPPPVGVEGVTRPGPFLLIADHAGNAVPQALGDLGLAARDLRRHIAIDIGILGVSRRLARALAAPLVYQRYSRLVIDCNRTPGGVGSVLDYSDGAAVPANRGLTPQALAARRDEIFVPYQTRIAGLIDRRIALGRPPVVLAMHSFTPRHGDLPGPRPWQVGVLYNRDDRLARALIPLLQAEGDLTVGINQPYAVDDAIDYAVPVHCEARGLLHVELEIRQDLIANARGQAAWAERLARLLPRALAAATVERAAG
jgi:predicted N-formylglutamate amidohydrolase